MTSILGISAFYHDSAAAIIIDGKIIAAAQEERFSRVKHDLTFPFKAIKYCLEFAKIQIQNLGGALKDFKRRCGIYPTTEQGLEALVEAPTSGRECKRYRPIIDKLPLDPWDTPFQYESDGKTYVIRSLGADGFEGGEDFDKDISSEDV